MPYCLCSNKFPKPMVGMVFRRALDERSQLEEEPLETALGYQSLGTFPSSQDYWSKEFAYSNSGGL